MRIFKKRYFNNFENSCLENPRDGGAWWAAFYGVAQSRTRLTLLSSSSRDLSREIQLTKMGTKRNRGTSLVIRWLGPCAMQQLFSVLYFCPRIRHFFDAERCIFPINTDPGWVPTVAHSR